VSQRCKGQEVELILLVDGVAQQNFTFIRQTDFAFKLEIKEEGYIGETTQRFDSIFNGIRGKATCHFDNPDILNVASIAIKKATRRVPGTRFNIKQTLNFGSGRRARIIVPDVELGEIPLNFGGRGSYGETTIDYAASEAFSLIL